ncbi:hypothetical protein KIW84_031821 [Lathyrus oleraceus]|uniref:Sec23/Sec24 beta-sandwich domain-containing protein n=1 Tax=Pisum sativum TaxID=3888 RepID=A0A9D5B139_PEA|nr:hypothetical protein KIW84_031821 [Pisum sativum]
MRVRCSQGIQVQEYYGDFCRRIPTDVDLPGIDCDKTFMVTLKHDDKLQDGSECAFQYANVYGQRRMCHNLIPASHKMVACQTPRSLQRICYCWLCLHNVSVFPNTHCHEETAGNDKLWKQKIMIMSEGLGCLSYRMM